MDVHGILTLEFGKGPAERGGEFDQHLILLRRKIVLPQVIGLDFTFNRIGPGRMADEARAADASSAEQPDFDDHVWRSISPGYS